MKTYDEILTTMTEKYTELSGIVPHEASDISMKLQILSGEIYASLVNFEWLKRQIFADTAQGEYLDKHAESRGLRRREAGFASGEVTFSVTEAAVSTLDIPVGTVVATEGEESLRFETTEPAKISVGETQTIVPVRAICAGKAYNATAGSVTVMVTPPTGVQSVTNADSFTGGDDAESDEQLRLRIIESFKNVSNGTNCAYYKNIALQVPGVSGAAVVPLGRGLGTVDVYIASRNTEVSDEELESAQTLLESLREVNVDVLVKKANPVEIRLYINLEIKDGYEFADVKENCISALTEYINTRGVGGKVLLTEAGERVYHVDGVKEYIFTPLLNTDRILDSHQYPVVGLISIEEGIER